MRDVWRIILVVLLISSFANSKRKFRLRKHRLSKQRQDVEKVEPRKGFPKEEDRNVSTVNDFVHKYRGKEQQGDSEKRHYLGQLNGVEQAHILGDKPNGILTANVGVHPESANVGYLDAAHGIATTLNSQQLQVGTQPKPAHHPSDEGLNPLPMYHSKEHLGESTVSAAFPIQQHGVIDGHMGADSHIVNGRVTDGLAGSNHIDIGGTSDQTVVASPNLEQEKEAFLQQQQGTMNIVQDQGISPVNHVQDLHHVHLGDHAAYPEVVGHHVDDYYHGGVELEHQLSNQQPMVISHPPIHITKQHYHASYHDVEDQGGMIYKDVLSNEYDINIRTATSS